MRLRGDARRTRGLSALSACLRFTSLAAQRPVDWSLADEWTIYVQEDRLEPIREVVFDRNTWREESEGLRGTPVWQNYRWLSLAILVVTIAVVVLFAGFSGASGRSCNAGTGCRSGTSTLTKLFGNSQ